MAEYIICIKSKYMNKQSKITTRCALFMLKLRTTIESKGLQPRQLLSIPYKNITMLAFLDLVKKVDPEMRPNESKLLFNDLSFDKNYVQYQNFSNIYDKICKKFPNQNPESQDNKFQKSQEKTITTSPKAKNQVRLSNKAMLDKSASTKKIFQNIQLKSETKQSREHLQGNRILLTRQRKQRVKTQMTQQISKRKLFFKPQLLPFQYKRSNLNQISEQKTLWQINKVQSRQNINNPLLKKQVKKQQQKHQELNKKSRYLKAQNQKTEKEENQLPSQVKLQKNEKGQFPLASCFFRRDISKIQNRQREILQHLQSLLENKNTFIDISNPETHEGHYMSCQNIFKQQNYCLFEVSNSVGYRHKNRTGIAQKIEPKDIIQGKLGDCYYLSSIASIAYHYPQIISQRFLLQKNNAGLYAIELFIDGEWKIYKTDASFPCNNQRPCFSKPHGRKIWVMLLEKCWAKVYGKFSSIVSGSSTEAFKALTGGPCEQIKLQTTNESINKFKIALQQATEKRYLVTTSGNKTLESMQNSQQKIGLVGDHSYSIFRLVKINNQTLVKMCNPWGKTVWLGRWSFNSKQWTQSLKEKYNYKKSGEDGIFYIPWQEYIKYFGDIIICKAKLESKPTSLKINCNRRKSNYIQLTVNKQGLYYLSIYQQSKRKFGKHSDYDFSPARIIILKKQANGQLKYISSINKASQVATAECILQPGKYIVSAKVAWINHEQYQSSFCCYGPQKVLLKQISRDIAVQFKQKMIQSYAIKMISELKCKNSNFQWLDVKEAYEEYYFDIKRGIGFLKISNTSEKTFNCTYTMTKMKGIKIIKPKKSPFQLQMKPGTTEIVGFFVSHNSYEHGWNKKGKKV